MGGTSRAAPLQLERHEKTTGQLDFCSCRAPLPASRRQIGGSAKGYAPLVLFECGRWNIIARRPGGASLRPTQVSAVFVQRELDVGRENNERDVSLNIFSRPDAHH